MLSKKITFFHYDIILPSKETPEHLSKINRILRMRHKVISYFLTLFIFNFNRTWTLYQCSVTVCVFLYCCWCLKGLCPVLLDAVLQVQQSQNRIYDVCFVLWPMPSFVGLFYSVLFCLVIVLKKNNVSNINAKHPLYKTFLSPLFLVVPTIMFTMFVFNVHVCNVYSWFMWALGNLLRDWLLEF